MWQKRYNRPPRLAQWLLGRLLRDEKWETPLGDFEEYYRQLAGDEGVFRAGMWYRGQVARLLIPKLLSVISWRSMMFRNDLKIALRNLNKNRLYSSVSILGLAVGLACCMLILLYIRNELRFDRHHQNAENIYRVITEEKKDDGVRRTANSYCPLRPALLNDFPEIRHVVRFFPQSVVVRRSDDLKFQENRFFYTDSTVFRLFSFSFVSGDARTALSEPYSLVVTESAAKKYFGAENPLGQVLNIENQTDMRITGVIRDPSPQSHFHFDFLASITSLKETMGWVFGNHGWYWPPMYTYVLLPERVDARQIESRFPDLVRKYIGPWAVGEKQFHLQPLTDIYLHSRLENEIEPVSSVLYLYIYATVAFSILVIACLNFMSLTTARQMVRAKEIGLRKVVGARRAHLIRQFMGESLVTAFVSFLIAVVLVPLLLPVFSRIIGHPVSMDFFRNGFIPAGFILLTAVAGICSGLYPALVVSSLKPVCILSGRGGFQKKRRSLHFNTFLVIGQFVIFIVLIGMIRIITDQLTFIRNKRLGFDKERLIVVPVHDAVVQQDWETVKAVISGSVRVKGVGATSTIPGRQIDLDFPVHAERLSRETEWRMETMIVDHDFIKTMGLEIHDGRGFSKLHPTDKTDAFILNETAVAKLGWDNPVGKDFEMKYVTNGGPKTGRVIGVVKDFHFHSLYHTINPLVLQIAPDPYYLDYLVVRIASDHYEEALRELEAVYRKIVPHRPFEFSFLDEDLDRLYLNEERLETILNGFVILAVLVGCMGLFALASYTAQKRRKEIGVRKVMGASVTAIVILLVRELTQWVFIGNIIAAPILYGIGTRWLQSFAYRIPIGADVFCVSTVLALVIAWTTVGYQAVSAACTDPVKILRYE